MYICLKTLFYCHAKTCFLGTCQQHTSWLPLYNTLPGYPLTTHFLVTSLQHTSWLPSTTLPGYPWGHMDFLLMYESTLPGYSQQHTSWSLPTTHFLVTLYNISCLAPAPHLSAQIRPSRALGLLTWLGEGSVAGTIALQIVEIWTSEGEKHM